MKRTMWLLIPVLVVILLSGCMSNTEETVEYISPEELFEYIETHDVGVAVEDFEGIDMEEFIKFRVGDEINPNYDFKAAINLYWYKKQRDEIDVYLAYEIKQVDSTDEEFEEFKTRFVEAIEEKGMAIAPQESSVTNCSAFDIEAANGNVYTSMIGQTKKLKEIEFVSNGKKIKIVKGDRNRNDPAYIDFISTTFRQVYGEFFYYNNNEKFYLFFYGMDRPPVTIDVESEITKIFHDTE